MDVEWRLFADLAERAGERRVAVSVADGATVEDALAALFEAHPALRERVLDGTSVADHVNLLHEGEPVAGGEAALDAPVADGDELALFPPVSGG